LLARALTIVPLLVWGCVWGCLLPAAAAAGEQARLSVSFTPDRLGADTSIATGVKISDTAGTAPSPVTSFDLYLPASTEIGASSLGLAICSSSVLSAEGPEGCSPNARIGSGSAVVAVPFGPELLQETASIVALLGTPEHEQVVMLLYAESKSPILAQLILPGELLPDSGPFGERLASTIPLTPTLPGAGDVAVTELNLNIDPPDLIYDKRVHGRIVGYHPQGVAIPTKCPRGGFPFAATLRFQDGDTTTTTRTVPCPPRARRR
jgi:hypothetical protein